MVRDLIHRLMQYLAAVVIAGLIRCIGFTLRWELKGIGPNIQPWNGEGPILMAFWHGRMLMMPVRFNRARRIRKGKTSYALISLHRDGRMIAYAIRLLGIGSIAGSSSRGGAAALVQMKKLLEDGNDVAITPDGPRGPIYQSKIGIMKLAQVTGLPVIPMTYAAERCWRFRSWDKLILPKPFSRAVMIIGNPIFAPKDVSDLEPYRQQLDTELIRITETADKHEYAKSYKENFTMSDVAR